jgi:hypothetical protein
MIKAQANHQPTPSLIGDLQNLYTQVIYKGVRTPGLERITAQDLIDTTDLTLRGEYIELNMCLNALAHMKGTLEAKKHLRLSKEENNQAIRLSQNADAQITEKTAKISETFRNHAELRRLAFALKTRPPRPLLKPEDLSL